MRCAMGISVHTGWAACVVIGGTARQQDTPNVIASQIIEILPDPERFCFHAAALMSRATAASFIAQTRKTARATASRALAPLYAHGVTICAIVAREGEPGTLSEVLASHPRMHTAEGCFYRDVLAGCLKVPVHIIPPSELDPSQLGKLAGPPWGRDQKLATLAAWRLLTSGT